MRFAKRVNGLLRLLGVFAISGVFTAGCVTGDGSDATGPRDTSSTPINSLPSNAEIDTVYVGDRIHIAYADAPITIPATDTQVPANGKLIAHLGYEIQVANRKTYEIQKELHDYYVVKAQQYNRITITVDVIGRTVSVGGEVKAPASYPHDGNITVLSAINKAGGFTEYAERKKVTVTHLNGETYLIDCRKALKDPTKDKKLIPGDRVNVPRGIFSR
jgi:protein involved in polysaccharide export with SLBB domain